MGDVHIQALSPAVMLLEIDSPPVNALGAGMRRTFLGALDQVETNHALRCLIVTGRGRAFCAGDDLKDVSSGDEELAGFPHLLTRLENTRVPVVAAINGACVGGGFELALCCDIRVASTEASFVCAGVNMGLMASTYRLPRLIGVSRAKAMLLTGLPHDAHAAERSGLVTSLHPPEALRDAAIAVAERIASRAPLSVEATKRTANRAMDLAPEDADRMWSEDLRVLRRSNDHKAAVTAFRDRTKPVFTRS